MEYYCIMVNTGKEQAFKKALKEKFPDIQFFFLSENVKNK